MAKQPPQWNPPPSGWAPPSPGYRPPHPNRPKIVGLIIGGLLVVGIIGNLLPKQPASNPAAATAPTTQAATVSPSESPRAKPTASPKSWTASDFDSAANTVLTTDSTHSTDQTIALLRKLAAHCTDDPRTLANTAWNIQTDLNSKILTAIAPTAYDVLARLYGDTASSAKAACNGKLAKVETELTPSDSSGSQVPAGNPPVILSPSGRYYRAGEFCPHDDDGLSTVDANGNTITCSDVNGYYRWHY